MNSKQLGNTEAEVSEFALGTWQFVGGIEPLRVGIDLGAYFIDTAEAYGTELLVGQAIRGMRDRVFLASKVSPRHFRWHDVIKAAECSLKELNTDYLDLYQLHWPNYTVPIGETLAAMERLVEMGKVRFIGVSNFTLAELRRAQSVLSSTHIVSNQVRYSLVARAPEEGLLQYCTAEKISLLAFSPLATGLNHIRRRDPDDALGRVGAVLGKTRAQVALNWCVSHPAVITIFKADRVEHVRENCDASGWKLSVEHLQFLEKEIRHKRRNRPEQFARRLVRRALQYAGHNLGSVTVMDRDHKSRPKVRT